MLTFSVVQTFFALVLHWCLSVGVEVGGLGGLSSIGAATPCLLNDNCSDIHLIIRYIRFKLISKCLR